MLSITITGIEVYDEETNSFSTVGDVKLDLEHSLLSLSKWESKFEKPFLSNADKTSDEIFCYIKFMILTQNYDETLIDKLSEQNLRDINSYIESKQSATTFGETPKAKGKGETITSELIYYWMIAFNIPFECERWHLNKLFSLIRVCNVKNSKPTKMTKNELAARNRELNEQRKATLGTNG